MKHWMNHACIAALAMACLTAPVEAGSAGVINEWERNILLRAVPCLIANGQIHGGYSNADRRKAEEWHEALQCDKALAELQDWAK